METTEITITKDEAGLVALLLDLYESAWANGNHKKNCDCNFCSALDKAGDQDFRLFDSLAEKCQK